jgi:integrase
MSTEIVTTTPAPLASLAETAEQAREYARASKVDNTKRGYSADWRDFTSWCEAQALASLPAAPETVALYLTQLADRCKVATLARRVAAISQAHQAAGFETPTKAPTVRVVMQGIRRTKGTAPAQKAPALTADLVRMLDTLPATLLGTRDAALLLVGFAGAFRRSELVALDVADLAFSTEGLTVTIRRSKTDQEGQGRKVAIPYGSNPQTCPVRAARAWLTAGEIAEGPVFRAINRHGTVQPGRLSDKAVALVVKRAAEAAGLDPANYAGHSLRAGLATSAAAAGVSERAIMEQTGHKSVTVARRYIREGNRWRDNAAGKVGL